MGIMDMRFILTLLFSGASPPCSIAIFLEHEDKGMMNAITIFD